MEGQSCLNDSISERSLDDDPLGTPQESHR
ncbi:hypothetical protein ERTO105960_07530 [Erysipelothrix tonsillarum]